MAVPDLVGVFIGPLEALGIPYMVTGVAAIVYGDPRFTRDINIVLWLAPEDAERFSEVFDPDAFYVPPPPPPPTPCVSRPAGLDTVTSTLSTATPH